MLDTTLSLLVAATTLSGILAGASLDQSIQQLPARHQVGVVAYSRYSQASDLDAKRGIAGYTGLGLDARLVDDCDRSCGVPAGHQFLPVTTFLRGCGVGHPPLADHYASRPDEFQPETPFK